MKRIVCELCDGIEFAKVDGMFVCQGCGTKYTADEAKALMREVEGAAPVATASAGPAVNPNQGQIDNILVLATTAYEAQNYAETENYCNQAIVLDAMCYKAWHLKAKAIGWQSKIDNLRIEEASHSFCKAIDFAPDEEKEEMKNQASEELKRLGLALIDLRRQRFGGNPVQAELDGFRTDRLTLLNALTVLLSHGNIVGIPDGYLSEIAEKMSSAANAALTMATAAWRKLDHPNHESLNTFIDWCSNIQTLIQQSIDACDDDDEADIERYRLLKRAIEAPIGKWSQKQQYGEYSGWHWVNEFSLSDSAVKLRRNQMADCDKKITELQKKVRDAKAAAAKKAEEEKQARIKAYWEAHPEEKAELENVKKDMQSKVEKYTATISELKSKIETPGPVEAEFTALKKQIADLEEKKSKLGLFAGKEKKQLTDEIATLTGRRDALEPKVKEEQTAKNTPLKEEQDKLKAELTKAKKRIEAIDAELVKDPGQ